MARRRNLLPMTRIAEMRYYYSKGRRISELAAHFGVHESVASDIFHGRTHRMARRLGGPSGDGWGVAL